VKSASEQSGFGMLVKLTVPDLWQQEAVGHLRAGRDVVVHAPTGAGKTLVFELYHPMMKGCAVYTVPTRALANDKLAEWRGKGWDVGINTGDLTRNLDAKIVVATLETQKGRFLRKEGPRLLVIDEYQMIGDPNRGVNYELAIALAPPDTQLLLLSGSVANPNDVAAWLKRLGRDAVLVRHDERPVPLEEIDLLSLPDAAPASVVGFWPRQIFSALRAGLGPILVFSPRRNAAEKFATTLTPFTRHPLPLSQEQEHLAGSRLSKLLKSRIAYHHSGLSYGLRAGVIEPLAKNGQLDVVVATMGLAAGINFSLRSVLVTDTRYLAGNLERHVSPDELLQMFGRAGRRGLDETGYVLTTPKNPRLLDSRPLQLRRAQPLDWPALIAVMRGAAVSGDDPFAAASKVGNQLFAGVPVEIGVEHCLETGPRPCGCRVDMERARFARRTVEEMRTPEGDWVPLGPAKPVPLSDALAWDGKRFVRALSLPRWIEGIGHGSLCRLPGPKHYGREMVVGSFATADERGPDSPVNIARWLRKRAGKKTIRRREIEPLLFPILSGEPGGGKPVAAPDRGRNVAVQFDYGSVPVEANVAPDGRALLAPPTRETIPPPCRNCPDFERWCRAVPIGPSPAHAWRELGLIDADGIPTRRGVIFSFFNHGEGLAIAAALEDEAYPAEELVFDLANLRAGHRFAGLDSPYGGRLGIVSQAAFQRAEYPGFLEHGVPVNHGAGASEVIRAIAGKRASKAKLVTDELRAGDIERALIEWRSLLRHTALAPDLDWERWRELKRFAARYAEITVSPIPEHLPALLPQQLRRSL
jgi:hypothetical protein